MSNLREYLQSSIKVRLRGEDYLPRYMEDLSHDSASFEHANLAVTETVVSLFTVTGADQPEDRLFAGKDEELGQLLELLRDELIDTRNSELSAW